MSYKPRRALPGFKNPVNWAFAHAEWEGKPFDHRLTPYTLEPLMESALAMQAEEGERGGAFVMLKGRQAGLTAAAQTLGLWHLDMHGGRIIHTVPSVANSSTISDALNERVRQIKFETLAVPKFSFANRHRWSQNIKEFNNRPVAQYIIQHMLAGNQTNVGDAVRGRSSQIVIYDERATMPAKSVAIVRATTNTSPTPIYWNVGSAGDKGDDLDILFRASTKAEWAIPCDHCGKHTVLMPYGSNAGELQSIIERVDGKLVYACDYCRHAIDPIRGEWIHSDGDMRGYHITSMMAPWYDAHRLLEDIDDPNSDEQSLSREVCGLPHGGDAQTIAPGEIAIDDPPNHHPDIVIMAVDWGKRPGTSWLVLAGDLEELYVVDMGIVTGEHDDHVPQLMEIARKHGPDAIICDFGFEGGRIRKLNDLTDCAWSMHTGRAPTPGGVLEQIKKERRTKSYHAVKTWCWERTLELLRKRTIKIKPQKNAARLVEDVVNVHPALAGRGSGEFTAYEMTNQHFAACLMMGTAYYLRECRKRKAPPVTHGNPMKPSTLR